jgi:serine protease Do
VSLSDGRNLLENGETVYSVGCPGNQPGQLSSGIVDGPPRRLKNRLLWQVIMRIDPGSSGSPVFDDRGRLVAMVKGRFRGSSTVGFLTPLDTIMDFLLKRRP